MILNRSRPKHSFRVQVFCCVLAAGVGLSLSRNAIGELQRADPQAVGLSGDRLSAIDELAEEGMNNAKMPGCVVMIGRGGKIAFEKAYGYRRLEPSKEPMTLDTVFDMASITKPVATATSIMILLERGKIRLRDKVTQYIPEFGNNGKESVTVSQLLTHQAGFIPDNALADYLEGREEAFRNIYQLKPRYDPGSKFVYSDVGFVLLDDLIERQSGLNVHQFSQKFLFRPLGMKESGYLPADTLKARAATTEQREGRWMRGEVHDPRSYAIGGVAGHAGLFSTANDLAIYAQMMLNGGVYNGTRILSKATVNLMTSDQRIDEGPKVTFRGLGWDKLSGYSTNRGENMSRDAFGHGGFTGTVLWIDPQHDLFFIFLSNRVHPSGKGYVNRIAGRMATVAVGAIEVSNRGSTTDPKLVSHVSSDGEKQEKSSFGIDVLEEDGFAALAKQRVGLITNHTGVARDGRSTIEILHRSPAVTLTALFSPEHGLAGKLDQSMIGDGVDGNSGLRVFSLYGKSRQPSEEQLNEVDTIVFDIQDIGTRFYTYISTMGLAMQAAKKHGKRFVVLDRPNPINGQLVSGSLVDKGLESFVAFHDLPIRHGMTVGEIAKMLKSELDLTNLDLEIIPCVGWERSVYYDELGLMWINPSPNMRNLNQAILYPGVGVWETTNLSVGRGTDTPFELVGAPWLDNLSLSRELNGLGIAGVQVMARDFVPSSSKYKEETCRGIQISITDRSKFDSVKFGMAFACTLYRLHPKQWKIDDSMRLLCNKEVLKEIKEGKSHEEVLQKRASSIKGFMKRRKRYLLY